MLPYILYGGTIPILNNMKKLKFVTGPRKYRKHPDLRIIITTDIVILEYPDGRDFVAKKSDPRAKGIIKSISL